MDQRDLDWQEKLDEANWLLGKKEEEIYQLKAEVKKWMEMAQDVEDMNKNLVAVIDKTRDMAKDIYRELCG